MTMILVRVPQCQQAIQVFVEFHLDDPRHGTYWQVTAPGTEVEGRGRTMEHAIEDFAAFYSASFK